MRKGWAARLATGAAALALVAVPAQAQGQAKATKGAAAASAAAPGSYAQRFATLCAACHGADGRSDMPLMPVLAGQPSFYVITQLFLFREGRRSNEGMTAVAKTLTDNDMRGFADFIGTLPPVPAPPPTPGDAARIEKGRTLALQYKCVFCHGADFSGGQQVPRLAGQHEDYLRHALTGYRAETRVGYTAAMAQALAGVSAAEIDDLAYYLARFVPPPAPR